MARVSIDLWPVQRAQLEAQGWTFFSEQRYDPTIVYAVSPVSDQKWPNRPTFVWLHRDETSAQNQQLMADINAWNVRQTAFLAGTGTAPGPRPDPTTYNIPWLGTMSFAAQLTLTPKDAQGNWIIGPTGFYVPDPDRPAEDMMNPILVTALENARTNPTNTLTSNFTDCTDPVTARNAIVFLFQHIK